MANPIEICRTGKSAEAVAKLIAEKGTYEVNV